MFKYSFLLSVIFTCLDNLCAQQDAVYVNNNSFLWYNPAYNAYEQGDLNLFSKIQFTPTNYNGLSYAFTYGQQIGRTKSALGMVIDYNAMIFQHTTQYKLSYSYKVNFGKASELSIGITPSVYNITLNTSQLYKILPKDTSPPFLYNRQAFDLGLGLWYKNDKLFFGISVMHIPETRVRAYSRYPQGFNTYSISSTIKNTLYAVLGYEYKLNESIILRPIIIYRNIPDQQIFTNQGFSDFNRYGNANSIFDLNCDGVLKTNYLVGIGYRVGGIQYSSLYLKGGYTISRFILQVSAILPTKVTGVAADISLKIKILK